MTTETLQTIHQRKLELELKLQSLIEEFQRRPECRGVQVAIIRIEQVDWHNGYDPNLPIGSINLELASGPDQGYRIQDLSVTLLLK